MRMTGRPLAGLASTYAVFRTPLLICLTGPKDETAVGPGEAGVPVLERPLSRSARPNWVPAAIPPQEPGIAGDPAGARQPASMRRNRGCGRCSATPACLNDVSLL